ncbi:MAG: hypothetical protein HY898_06555 [Deltaproteobacteria bacterium]|nr:hypothetical protein [Deltaproteobacteria bacterium]
MNCTNTRALDGRTVAASLLALLLTSCIATADAEDVESPEPIGTTVYAITVGEAVGAGCSTTSVKGLALQIVDQVNCLKPGALSKVPDLGNVTFGAAAFPYMQTAAKTHFVDALNAKPSTAMTVNSMLRSLPQQYLLYRWYKAGQCGITLAAAPGNSPHERGVGVDISQHSTWQSTLTAHGFTWQGSSDPVHFTYTGSGTVDMNGLSVLAFQKLWNLNHPTDKIAEDGDYGPQTESKLKVSPAEGFAKVADCSAPTNNKPKGYLDGADCDKIWGWAQDPDTPATSIAVEVYIDGAIGDAKAQKLSLKASIKRDDLCTPLGSCEHGFEVETPAALLDGKSHTVRAYGIDSKSGPAAELSDSPKTLKCSAPPPATDAGASDAGAVDGASQADAGGHQAGDAGHSDAKAAHDAGNADSGSAGGWESWGTGESSGCSLGTGGSGAGWWALLAALGVIAARRQRAR